MLPDGDVRAQDINGRVWQTIVLSVDPALIDRAAFGGGEFTVGAHAGTDFTQQMGYGTKLTADAAAGAVTLQVTEGSRLAVGDTITLGTGTQTLSVDPHYDRCTVTAIAGNTVTIGAGLAHAHHRDDIVTKIDAHGGSVKLTAAAAAHAATIHVTDGSHFSVNDGFAIGTGAAHDHGTITAIAGWWTGAEPSTEADFDTWVAAMGAAAWAGATSGAPGHTTPITDADKAKVRTAITRAVANGSGPLFAQGLPAAHPIMRNRAHNVPVIVAAEACLSRGDSFYVSPEALYATGGKVFSVSNWYRKFMYHHESIRAARLSDYSLYAPAEFFAETYTVFYEEAGRPGVTEADYGRLISNASQRNWIRTHIHDRHLAPAGAAAGGGHGGAPGPEGAVASGASPGGVEPGGGGTGKKTHRSGP